MMREPPLAELKRDVLAALAMLGAVSAGAVFIHWFL
jgi:hypothetical protein